VSICQHTQVCFLAFIVSRQESNAGNILVIIKGTQVYDSGRGAFVDLSVLDVLQIFGRAGRPGMETSGVGYICTTDDKLDHYLDAITSQVLLDRLCSNDICN
jgi:replicative superfamily II helicase